MTIAVRIFQWMTGLAGLGALIPGLLYWTANPLVGLGTGGGCRPSGLHVRNITH